MIKTYTPNFSYLWPTKKGRNVPYSYAGRAAIAELAIYASGRGITGDDLNLLFGGSPHPLVFDGHSYLLGWGCGTALFVSERTIPAEIFLLELSLVAAGAERLA